MAVSETTAGITALRGGGSGWRLMCAIKTKTQTSIRDLLTPTVPFFYRASEPFSAERKHRFHTQACENGELIFHSITRPSPISRIIIQSDMSRAARWMQMRRCIYFAICSSSLPILSVDAGRSFARRILQRV